MKTTISFGKKSIFLIALLLSVFCIQSNAQDFNSYKRDAEKGDKNAQFYLALCYNAGKGVAKDFTKAAYWFKKSADQGVPEAQFNIALYYEDGEGIEQSYENAKKYLQKVLDNPKATDSLKKQAKEELSYIEDAEMLENFMLFGF